MSDIFKSVNFRVHTPSGTMFVNIMEDANSDPFQIDVFIGKAGSELSAWASATSGMVSLALRTKVPIQTIINELADITSDGTARIGASVNCRSGPEGIYSALIQYRNMKNEEANVREEGESKSAQGLDLRIDPTSRETASNS